MRKILNPHLNNYLLINVGEFNQNGDEILDAHKFTIITDCTANPVISVF